MNGVILVNAYIRSEGAVRQAERIKEELAARGIGARIEKNGNFLCRVAENRITIAENTDFCVYLDKDKYLSRMLEKCGVRLFNSAESVELCDDKMLTYIALAGGGVNLPDTLPAPLCYYADAKVRQEYVKEIGAALGYPLIAKKSFGSWGMDVELIQNEKELAEVAEKFRMSPHLYQKYVAAHRGEDYRVLVVGGRSIAVMKRTNRHDFRSNIECGGTGSRAEVPADFIAQAERCAEILGLDYCGVDILDDGGRPVVCEVNSNAFFNEAEKVTGVNVAGAFAGHIASALKCAEAE
ncbi:MAG TPA: RimK family alpha-L-glutamate ligase [Candidatus Borkfalkia avistercoris]|uniref:RimK family alpha-L-glutamate ligase n=1 Tax=Candidatus Borkfalkia avistercoris TaxID=2838504 RepID=A0A9D2A664_9FIRM|nr:RimK family alpha-L-glutamate ligase [Candidatus Borkfalkia avistercoris]